MPGRRWLRASRFEGARYVCVGAISRPRMRSAYDRIMSMFELSEEHEALRAAVRELATDKIAPRAADIDRTAEFPWDVHDALVKADFHALHIPEQSGGAAGGALARGPVIEEVARPC